MSEARDVEARLRESQVYNRTIIEAFPFAVVVFDPNLRITDVNEEAIRLTGFGRGELIGSPLDDHFEIPAPAFEAVRRTLYHGTKSRVELMLKPRTGSYRSLLGGASTFRDPHGGLRGLLATAPA